MQGEELGPHPPSRALLGDRLRAVLTELCQHEDEELESYWEREKRWLEKLRLILRAKYGAPTKRTFTRESRHYRATHRLVFLGRDSLSGLLLSHLRSSG